MSHVTHLCHSGSLHRQNDSFCSYFWVILSVYWPTMAQMSQMTHLGFSVNHRTDTRLVCTHLNSFSVFNSTSFIPHEIDKCKPLPTFKEQWPPKKEKKMLKNLGAISRTTVPIPGLFVLIWIHFYAESKYGNENFAYF